MYRLIQTKNLKKKYGSNKQPINGKVARLTPDQKVACSNHVGVTRLLFHDFKQFIKRSLILPVTTITKNQNTKGFLGGRVNDPSVS